MFHMTVSGHNIEFLNQHCKTLIFIEMSEDNSPGFHNKIIHNNFIMHGKRTSSLYCKKIITHDHFVLNGEQKLLKTLETCYKDFIATI